MTYVHSLPCTNRQELYSKQIHLIPLSVSIVRQSSVFRNSIHEPFFGGDQKGIITVYL